MALRLRQVVLDCPDARQLAEFYRELLGYPYRPGDESVDPAGDDWLVLRDPDRDFSVAFQQIDTYLTPTWPDGPRPQMSHLDITVDDTDELLAEHERVLHLGGRMLYDRLDDPQEPLRVYADPVGHPFCIFVG